MNDEASIAMQNRHIYLIAIRIIMPTGYIRASIGVRKVSLLEIKNFVDIQHTLQMCRHMKRPMAKPDRIEAERK